MNLRYPLLILLFLASAVHARADNTPAGAITVEANAVEIILNDEHRDGVDWGAIVSDFHTAYLKKNGEPDWNDKKYRLSYGTVSQDDYAVLLDALDTVGQMSQSSQLPVKVFPNNLTRINFEKRNIHVDLVLKRLKSGDLSLRVAPHLAVATMEILNGEKIPSSIDLQSQTDMLVSDNTTIVIGGFIKEEEMKRTHKFPLLGNIPIVGLVFRSQGRLMQKSETVIFLTVRTNALDAPEDDDQR